MKQLSDKMKELINNELLLLSESNNEFNVNKYHLFINARDAANEEINYRAYRKEIDELIRNFCTDHKFYFKRSIKQEQQNNFINYFITKDRLILRVKSGSRNRIFVPAEAVKAAKWSPGDILLIVREVDFLGCVSYKLYNSKNTVETNITGELINYVTIEKDNSVRFTPHKTDTFIDIWLSAVPDLIEVY